MLKKRVIFTLLYRGGYFYLSRNFRLQRIGDPRWLACNYGFSKIACSIDELIMLDISEPTCSSDEFLSVVEYITNEFFAPLALGGRIRSLSDAENLIRSGADKIVINTILATSPALVADISSCFGSQAIVGSVDYRIVDGEYKPYIDGGVTELPYSLKEYLEKLSDYPIGELYLNSIDQDGTGNGLDLTVLNQIPASLKIPLILSGGIGQPSHMYEGLSSSGVDAIATASLLNFIGDGLPSARSFLIGKKIRLANWSSA
jgi:cyclase